MIDASHYFSPGGTLDLYASSYVERPADAELLRRLLEGNLCYVLTARQMGKSSLMVRTADRLRDQGVQSAIIDLTSIGTETVTVDQWYLGLLTALQTDLLLEVDVIGWWERYASLGQPQRFRKFLREEVLGAVSGPVVIFIDEIDSTLALTFCDDFFAALRAIYNARGRDRELKRLTFVLIGAAAPNDLIHDRDRTPFNVGHQIVLGDLAYADARALRDGLEAAHPGQGDRILRRIFHWTSGQPYLTQRICAEAASRPSGAWDDAHVDELVERLFFAEDSKDLNLASIRNNIQSAQPHERRRMLKLYRDVFIGREVPDKKSSLVQNRLEISGLVRVGQGRVQVRNALYRRAFDADWIRVTMPGGRQRRVLAAAGAIAALAVAVVLFVLTRPPAAPAELAALQVENFRGSERADIRMSALSTLFRLGYDRAALDLFYGLSPDAQLDLFGPPLLGTSGPERGAVSAALVDVIREIAPTLDQSLPDGQSDALLSAMRERAGEASQFELVGELLAWGEGRALRESDPGAARAAYDEALRRYAAAAATATLQPTPLGLYQVPPALAFERARLAAAQGRPAEALDDLDALVGAFGDPPADPALGPEQVAEDPAARGRVATARALNPLLDGARIGDAAAALVLADEALWRALVAAPERYPHLLAAGLLQQARAQGSATAQAQTAGALAASATAQAETATARARASATAAARAAIATATHLAGDPDGDGLSTAEEQELGTSPDRSDSDGDGVGDGEDADPLVAPTPTATATPRPSNPTARPSSPNPTRRPAAPTAAPPASGFPTPILTTPSP